MTEEDVNKAMWKLNEDFDELDPDGLVVCDLCTKERIVEKVMLVIRVDEDYSSPPVGFYVCTTCYAFYDNDPNQINERLDSRN